MQHDPFTSLGDHKLRVPCLHALEVVVSARVEVLVVAAEVDLAFDELVGFDDDVFSRTSTEHVLHRDSGGHAARRGPLLRDALLGRALFRGTLLYDALLGRALLCNALPGNLATAFL